MGRVKSLDGLRGLAALVVVFHHASLAVPDMINAWFFRFTPLRLLVEGPSAVVVFFVLSGFVLTPPFLLANDLSRYPAFAMRRIVRIWVPLAAAVTIAAGLTHFVIMGPLPDATVWFHSMWTVQASLRGLFEHLSLRSLDLDNPMWSLVHELRVSLVFPLLVACVAWRPLIAVSAAVGLHLFAAATHDLLGWDMGSGTPMLETIRYLLPFVVGIALAANRSAVMAELNRGRPGALLALLGCALVGLAMRALTPGPSWLFDSAALIFASAAGAFLVALALTDRYGRLLEAPPFLFLGRISYSLYLIHVIVILAVARGLAGALPHPVLIGLAAVLCVPLAAIFHHLVERPALRFALPLGRASRVPA